MDADNPREKCVQSYTEYSELGITTVGNTDGARLRDQEGFLFEGEGEAIFAGHNIHKGRLRSPSVSRSNSSDATDKSLSISELDPGSPDAGIDAVTCPRPLCSSSPVSSYMGFDLSNMSARDPSGFEGEGGNVSVVDHIALQTENSELRYQIRRLNNEIEDLKLQISASEESQQVLQGSMDELEKKLAVCKSKCEKLKHATRELEDAKSALAGYEDKIKVLIKRIERLERDTSDLTDGNESLKQEVSTLRLQLDNQKLRNVQLEKEILSYKQDCSEKIQELLSGKANLEEQCKNLQESLQLSSDLNQELLKDNRELENRLTAANEKYVEPERESYLSEPDCVEDDTSTLERDILFKDQPITPSENSLHAEITASLTGNISFSTPSRFRHDSLINYEGSGNTKPWSLDSFAEYPYPTRCKLKEILEVIQLLRMEFMESIRVEKAGEDRKLNGNSFAGIEHGEFDKGEKNNALSSCDPDEKVPTQQSPEADVVRRIQDELAEFRIQLKKSQEIFTAFNSCQSFTVTKSCPLLSEENSLEPEPQSTTKPALQSSSTQTDDPVILSPKNKTSVSTVCQTMAPYYDDVLSRQMEDMQLEDNDLDRLSGDEDSVQLSLGLPTVEEESEQETDPSPDSVPRGMSSGRTSKRKLTRMPNMIEDSGSRSDNETNSPEYHSAIDSYNSKKRPLEISGTTNGGHVEKYDAASITSDNDTTFGSPITSPSSPSYYYTPSQGSSSQETLTNPDGDRTPVNEYYSGDDAYAGSPMASDSSSLLRKRNIPKELPLLPIDQRGDDRSSFKGVVGEKERKIMTAYAYDPIMRSVDPKASVLPRSEWRVLRQDLTEQELAQFNKHHAQEEGGEADAMDGSKRKFKGIYDLDDEAEKYSFEAGYPGFVEQLFSILDLHVQEKSESSQKLSKSDVEKISKLFTELSISFKSSHASLDIRERSSKSELDETEERVKKYIGELQKRPDEGVVVAATELQEYTEKLIKKAKEVGRIDLERRTYRMIEVMTMYVHILKNFENPDFEGLAGSSKESGSRKQLIEVTNGSNEVSTSVVKNKDLRKKDLHGGQWLRWCGKFYKILRELSWPWNWEQSMIGVQRCFTIIIMLAGLVILVQNVIPSASAEHCTPTVHPFITVLEKYSMLIHQERPTL